MHLSVYVGPYFVVSRSVWEDVLDKWESLVRDGRGEAGVSEPDLILVPNRKLPGISRSMRVEIHGKQDMCEISGDDIRREVAAFTSLANELLEWCEENDVHYVRTWGVVPCWS